MLGMFAGLALLLALAGVYGVLSYWLNRRTAEIGLRAALGAGKRDILGVTISQGLKPVLVGVAGGLTGSVLLSGYLETLLFEIKAADFLTYVSGAGVVTLTALISCMLPALRAARIDPARALRNE
jgi:putative ABC transport system permease protein